MLDLHPYRDIQEISVERDRARVGLWAASVVMGLIVLLGAVIVAVNLTRGAGGPKVAPQPATGITPSTSGSAPAMATPTAGVEAPRDVPPLTAAPKGVHWELFQTVALPTSATDGPKRIAGPVHAGYSRTPTGALLAEQQIAYRFLITPGTGWRQVVEQQVVDNEGRARYIGVRAKVTDDSAKPGQFGQTAGFRFVTYTPDVAVIQVVTRYAGGNYSMVTDTVRWVDGDWKLELQPDGSTTPTRQDLSGVAGFIPWGGV